MELNKYIDHTLLKSYATDAQIEKLCEEAKEYNFASVCVNPVDVPLAKKLLTGSNVKVCTVIGFPLGRNKTEIKVAEAISAYNDGCDEFDMVINVGCLKDGKDDYVKNEIAEIVKAVNGRLVKVIIESAMLTDDELVRAVRLSCEAGADFVKTCTGFTGGVATVEAVSLMKKSVTNGVKVKASAGIRNYEDALKMIEAGAERLGTSAGVEIIKSAKN